MKITISDWYGEEYSATVKNGANGDEISETFDRLMVLMGFTTDIRCSDGGHYELKYVSEEEE